MASFVELDENNIVLRGIFVENAVLLDEYGIERENIGIEFCQNLLAGKWIQTSYNGTFRGRYAGTGYFYNEQEDEFYPPFCRNREEYQREMQRIETISK